MCCKECRDTWLYDRYLPVTSMLVFVSTHTIVRLRSYTRSLALKRMFACAHTMLTVMQTIAHKDAFERH